MTAEEKAKELTWRYYFSIVNAISDDYSSTPFEIAKDFALMTVDEILESVPKQPSISITMPHFEATVYWEEVKQEIEKL